MARRRRKRAADLDKLRAAPMQVPGGLDDPALGLCDARFLGGTVADLKQLWLAAREVLPLEGPTPLNGYDLDSMGLTGSVTTKGWLHVHNPASSGMLLKFFSSANTSTSAQANKRLTLAEGESAINVGDSMKDIADLSEFQTALRAARTAMQLACPWNFSIAALEGFMLSSNFCAKDLAGRPNRAALLTEFTNQVFRTNATRWRNRQPFLATGDLRHFFENWFGNQPASLLSVKEDTGTAGNTAQGGQRFNNRQQHNNSRASWWRDQRQHDGGSGAGGHKGRGGFVSEQLCRRFNAGTCPNSAASCSTANGVKLSHLCSHEDKNGRICKRDHPKFKH